VADSTVTIGGDISDLQAKLKQAGSSITSFGAKTRSGLSGIFDSVGEGINGLLPAMGLAAVVGRVKGLMNDMDDLADTALRLGESTETLQRVEYATTLLSGVDLDGVTTSFLRLEKSLGDVENVAAGKALENYGITAEGLARLPLDEKIVTIAEAFQEARATGTGYNDLLDLLGKSAGDLIPLFEQSGAAIREAFADAPVVLDGTVQRIAAMNDQVDAFVAKQKGGFADFLSTGLMMADDILDPNKSLGDNMASASAGADKSLADQQARRDKAAEAIGAAQAEAKQKSDAANAATRMLAITREIEAVEKMREQIGQRQFQGLLRHLTPTLQIEALEKRITAEKEKQAQQQNVGPVSESAQLENLQSMLELEDRLAQAKQARAEAATAAAEEERQANEKLLSQQSALADILAQTEILRAQAAGDDKKATALQREAEIQANVKSILDATNLSEQEALKLAREQQDLKDQIAKQGDTEDTAGRIDASIGPGGAEGARQRAEQRMQEARDRVDGKGIEGQFGREDAAQRERFAKQFGPGADPRQNPAALDAAKNQQAAAQPAESGQQIANQILEQVKAIIPLLS
jgi:hypothetical protein